MKNSKFAAADRRTSLLPVFDKQNTVIVNKESVTGILADNTDFVQKNLRFTTITNISRLPADIIGCYMVDNNELVRLSKPVRGCYAVYVQGIGNMADITDPNVAPLLIENAVKNVSETSFVMISQLLFATTCPLWSKEIENAYRRKYGTNIIDKLALLFIDAKGSARFRGRFYSIINELVLSNFVKPACMLCRDKGYKIYAYSEGDGVGILSFAMPFYSEFDGVALKVDKNTSYEKIKQFATVSGQQKKQVIALLDESYNNISKLDMLRGITDELYVNGIDDIFIMPDNSGTAKIDSWQENADCFTDYIDSVNGYFKGSVPLVQTLLLCPVYSAYSAFNIYNKEALEQLDEAFHQSISALNRNCVSYHFGDERVLKNAKVGSNGTIKIGENIYKKVVLPPTTNITLNVATLLIDFAACGGKIFCFGEVPHLIDGVISERVEKLASFIRVLQYREAIMLKSDYEPLVNVDGILSRVARCDDGDVMYMLVNGDLTPKKFNTTVNTVSNIAVLNPTENTEIGVKSDLTNGKLLNRTTFASELQAGESLYFRISKNKAAAGTHKNCHYIDLPEEWEIVNSPLNMLPLYICEWHGGDGVWSDEKNIISAISEIRESGVQKAEIRFGFNVDESFFSRLYIAANSIKKYKFKINGAALSTTETGNINGVWDTADISELVIAGFNSISVSLSAKAIRDLEFDGLFIAGNFTLGADKYGINGDNKIVLGESLKIQQKLSEYVKITEIERSGYWYFCGEMTLKASFNVAEKDDIPYKVGFTDLYVPCAKVSVNGNCVGTLGFKPYELSIEKYIVSGKNEITVTLYANSQNIMSVYKNDFALNRLGVGLRRKTVSFVEFQNVSKYYQNGGRLMAAVDNVSFNINKGEFVVVVGPSGAGKTTLLNILGGMDTCDEGTVIVDGNKVSEYNERKLTDYRRYDVGFVFQFYNLISNLTALENVQIASEICREPYDPKRTLQAVGLADRTDNFPAQLSGGEQQRVSIARALAKNPKILLCDEPTGALDYVTGKEILKLLYDTCKQTGKTVVVITHNSAICAMADRVIKIKNGSVTENSVNPSPTPAERIEW